MSPPSPSMSCAPSLSSSAPAVCSISTSRLYLLLVPLLLLFICNTAAVQSMNVAVGFVAVELEFAPGEVQWIQSAYSLSAGCLLLLFVPLCSSFGPLPIALFSALSYCLSSLGITLSRSSTQFIIFRALQGVGAAAAIPSGFALLGSVLPVVPGSTFRATIFSIYAAGAPLGSGLGTLIGGLATQYSAIGWRGIFASFAGISGLAFFLLVLQAVWPGLSSASQARGKVVGGVDFAGAALVTAALGCVVFSLSQGPAKGWRRGEVLGLLVLGVLLLPAFVCYETWIERRGGTPMLRMSNFRRGRNLAMNLLGLVAFAGFTTWDHQAGLYYSQIHHLDAQGIMLRFLPQSLGAFTGAAGATWLLKRISTQWVFMAGCLSAAMGSLIFAISSADQNYWKSAQFLSFFLSITGACFIFASGMLYSVSAVIPSEQSAAGSLFQAMTALAPSLGIVFATLVSISQKSVAEPDREHRYAFFTAMAYSLFAFVAAGPCLWGIGVIGKSGESKRVEELVVHDQDDAGSEHEKKESASAVCSAASV